MKNRHRLKKYKYISPTPSRVRLRLKPEESKMDERLRELDDLKLPITCTVSLQESNSGFQRSVQCDAIRKKIGVMIRTEKL
jgi:hypothetical protein